MKYILSYNHVLPFHANLFATNLLLNSRTRVASLRNCGESTMRQIHDGRGSLEQTCETKRYLCECRKTLKNVSQLECRATFVRHICKIRPNDSVRIARNCRINVHPMRLQHENRVSRNSRELVFSCRIPVRQGL